MKRCSNIRGIWQRELSRKIVEYEGLVYEAHSTDYQTESDLKALVEDHFCILKVGPWLTFAYREALFALESMEIEIMGAGNDDLSNLKDTMDKVMLQDPKHWEKYYSGTKNQQWFKRKYSFSDRSRYYWPDESINSAKNKLFKNLRKIRIPLSLLSQFMPQQFYKVLDGMLGTTAENWFWIISVPLPAFIPGPAVYHMFKYQQMRLQDKYKELRNTPTALLATNFYNFETLEGVLQAAVRC